MCSKFLFLALSSFPQTKPKTRHKRPESDAPLSTDETQARGNKKVNVTFPPFLQTKPKPKAATGVGATLASDSSLLAFQDRENPYLSMSFEPQNAHRYELRKSFKAHIAPISSIAMHPKKSIVATASDDNTVGIFPFKFGCVLILAITGHHENTLLHDRCEIVFWISSLRIADKMVVDDRCRPCTREGRASCNL